MTSKNTVVLIVLDGWGYSENPKHNAIAAAVKPQWNYWWQNCPHVLLNASGTTVGLPDGQMGNSEVGHMHIGAGRSILQDLTFINKAIETGEFAKNPVLINMIQQAKSTQTAIHVMGLFSPGGVHSHQNHLFAFLKLCAEQQFPHINIHLFLDGRDAPPRQIKEYLHELNNILQKYPVGEIRSLSGRYWAMDRDQRWSRVEPVYQLLTEAHSPNYFSSAEEAIEAYYAQGLSDEFFPPTRIGSPAPIADGDTVFYFNFRADRAKQLTAAFLADNFQGFKRQTLLHLAQFVSMTQYDEHLPTIPVFPVRQLHHTLGEVIASHGLHQLRIAETEKYAHVTFFFNGGEERKFALEDRVLIPSPQVATYDLQPEMSAPQLADALVTAIQSQDYDVIICNFANADMVGHSGNFSATVAAIEAIDRALQKIGTAIQAVQGHLLITADHGNAEYLFDDDTQQSHTAHTCSLVPLVYVGDPQRQFIQAEGSLIDIAPTVLALLDIQPPAEMTGHSLWKTS
ncbi:MAG: 2,3-bisphosphoglycerate-independent phosphoglycerate mutase [Gammaproteobacteria bacterium]